MDFPASSAAEVKCCITCNTFGVPAPMKEILEMCKTQRWVLIEDVCEAIGTTSDGQAPHLGSTQWANLSGLVLGCIEAKLCK